MNLKEQNWQNFTDQHLYDWHGIWTRYTPTGGIKESFRSLRHFESNIDKTEIDQLNQYILADDNIKEQKWHFNQKENSLDDGMFHPQAKSMRGYFFPSGHATWAVTQLQEGFPFGMELFFRYQHLRHSIGIRYDDQGNLFTLANIREDSTGYPSSFWSTELESLSSRNFNENFQGNSIKLTADLQISEPITTEFNWGIEGHKTFYLPDGVSISCPEKVTVGNPFSCVGNWLINEQEMQQLIANYDASGQFQSLTLESYELK